MQREAEEGGPATTQSRVRRPRATHTRLAVLGGAAIVAYLGFLFVSTVLTAAGVIAAPAESLYNPVYDGVAGDPGDIRNAEGYLAATFGFCLAASLPVVVGLWFRRAWARDAAYAVFGLPGLVLSVLSLAGITAENPAASAEWGVVVGLSLVAVTALVASPGCGRDFDRAAKHKEIAARHAAGTRHSRRVDG
ncbi:MAG: hypothetical protein ACRDYU_15500 [Actinomycetes bacterium]